MQLPSLTAPLGIFDSGVGGLSVLRAIRAQMPHENLLYFADQGHVPYGSRSLEEVRHFSEAITHFLLGQGAKLIVVACNTASAAALHYLRKTFPDIPFIGMEPAIKPAAEHTNSGVVGVLATPATFQGKLYASVVERFAKDVDVLQDTCQGLVEEIERGALEADSTRKILVAALRPMLDKGLDTVVLGCTHYPFVIPLIEEIVGESVRVIDPAPAVARQVERRLDALNLRQREEIQGEVQIFTSGEKAALESIIPKLREKIYLIQEVKWESGKPEIKGVS
ncbi:MAG: glutamate racemase [Anaerolineales bacterium]|uniref:Glutamate racemase n=1 Tax=Candidatus Desulfolinea nitratireducens TaxID=2841698 RepID=A0A8J6THV8_9CHLR|nr:glutamate racemase [Candidatus Desulfolinea nitratireducens]MBL6960655.1 glutamate racemase [Anaerolineales bacterium]